MNGTGRQAIVVGGGVVGAACAYYLARAGWAVTVLDRGGFGRGCSHGNCGFVCPSHVLPLAEPGAVGRTLRAMLRPNSPFTIRPRLDPALWAWLWRFWRRCNRQDMLAAGRAIQALLTSSRALYDELLRDEPFDCEWEAHGMLFVLQTRPALAHYAETVRLVEEEFGLSPERIDGDRLCAVEPALKPGLAGAFLYRTDAHLRPDRLMASWRRVLEGRGVTVRENCEVKGFVREAGRARAVVTAQGEMAADAFVLAAGALTPMLNADLGCRLPIQPGKGYSITMPRPAKCPTYPLIFEEHRVAVTPMRSGYRLGSTMEFAGYDTTLNRRRLDLLREAARLYLHEPYTEPVEEEWYGWR
ncbi:MAG TPA: FAD-dependent oxidoreductase, partial [Gemmataceae bacterium]|nr:FAD-dependent oxidoreductase [Gemmataceae bacterium]